jgi:glycogen synthase
MPLADMGKKGRAWMKSEFSWEQVGRRMLELYERVRNA